MKTIFTRITRRNPLGIAALLLTVTAMSASAEWHEFYHQSHVDYQRNNAWPDPFNEVDALQVTAPFEVMKHNGWRTHNTVGNELFRASDGQLSPSGTNHVKWVATQAPVERRVIYVLRGRTEEETNARVASVHHTLASCYIVGAPPQVIVTEKQQPTVSGNWANQITRKWMEVLPKPMLPERTAGGDQAAAQQ
ncbi:hypothetical protein Q31b_07430 [Novipirellula aureliae]|uniref:Uncharacterized protein n=1 Tax=Novipirellula aureliae TaxID=2527966 RepID=A0A5C6E9Q4_9BACT|nr:hypothetical protein [Novipirellula aureliae]TWU45568.1 hypothetical protein Q31b_07430 [Novipirellula aureliae]